MITRYSSQVSEQRRAFLLAFAVSSCVLLVLAVAYGWVSREEARCAATMKVIRREARDLYAGYGNRGLEGILRRETTRHEELSREWERLRVKTDTFRGRSPLADSLSASEEGRIDFKVALFEARDRLQKQAAAGGVSLPRGLGMDEAIGTDERAETRFWQLASVVKLVEACIRHGVPVVGSIEILDPQTFPLLEEEGAVAIEFPVRLGLRCSYEALRALLRAFGEEGPFFVVREFSMEKEELDAAELLEAQLVCGAILYQLRGEGDVMITAEGAGGDE